MATGGCLCGAELTRRFCLDRGAPTTTASPGFARHAGGG